MEEPLAYINGQFIPASSASLSPTDGGFVLGATIAEQLRTFAGKLFRLEDHLDRLLQSLKVVGVEPGIGREKLSQVAEELVARNHRLLAPGDDLGLSIFVTPGTYPAYSDEITAQPTLCLHTYRLPFRLWASKYGSGQALVTTDVQQVPPDCWPPGLKCRSRMHYYLADRRAATIEPGARALLLDSQGKVTETSTANLMIHTAEEGLLSPPSRKVLAGISMAQTVALAERLGVSTTERELTPNDVSSAGEVLLTSTPLCLLPVTRFNGRPIGEGLPGKLFRQLLEAWNDLVGIDVARQAELFSRRDA